MALTAGNKAEGIELEQRKFFTCYLRMKEKYGSALAD